VDVLRQHGLLLADRLEFVFERAGAAVLGELPSAERDALRLRGALLLHDEGRPPEDVARLLVDVPALDEPWMHRALRDAAADARRRGDPEAGVRFLNRLVEAAPDDAEAAVELATALSDIDPGAAMSHLMRTIERTADLTDRALLVSCLGVLAHRARTTTSPAFRLLGEVLDAFDSDAAEPNDLRTQVQAALLGLGFASPSTVRETLRRSRTMVVPDGDTPSERVALGRLAGTAMLDGGSAEQAADRATAAVSGAFIVHNGPPTGAARMLVLDDSALIRAAKILDHAGRPAEALAALNRIAENTRRGGAVRTHCQALAIRSAVATGMGRPATAAADATAAMEIARHENWALPRIAFAAVLVNQGEPGRAEAVLDGIRRPNFVWEYHEMLLVRARARLLLNDPEGGLSHLLRCGRSLTDAGIRSPMLAPWWLDAAVILTDRERPSEALALVEAQNEAITRWGTPESIGLGMLARGVATPGRRGLELMAEAAERLAASPARLSQLRAELLVGGALLRSGDGAAARRHLRRAVDLAVRCGSTASVSLANELLIAAGGRIRKRGGPSDLLTSAERRVVEQATAGASNREIAEALFVTLRTVETHLSNVYRKLGVSSRVEIDTALRELTPHPGRRAG
jgi:DNA-binding CsgD family transcriptional regulator